MTDRITTPSVHPGLTLPRSPLSRRRFLTVLGGTSLGLVACTNGSDHAGRPGATPATPTSVATPLTAADACPETTSHGITATAEWFTGISLADCAAEGIAAPVARAVAAIHSIPG